MPPGAGGFKPREAAASARVLLASGKKKLARTGATRTENVNAPHKANATVHAIGLNNRPSTRCKVKIGR